MVDDDQAERRAQRTLLGQIVMYLHPLTEQRYLEIVNEIAARRRVENEAAGRV